MTTRPPLRLVWAGRDEPGGGWGRPDAARDASRGAPRGRAADGAPDRDGRRGGEAPPGGRRILSLHLPRFAMERRLLLFVRQGRKPPEEPFALAVDGRHGPLVHAANPAAEAAGVHPGGRVADARAACPSLRVEPADPRGDEDALLRLALWARRWCPWTAPDRPDGVTLDATGSAHLWGGEEAMMGDVAVRLGRLGFSTALAVAPTVGAAWALARFGGGREACPPEALEARMAPLPVRALRLGPVTVLLLRRLGLRTVGDLLGIPRLSLARRFARADAADNPLLRLDQMLGRVPEPLDCPDEPPRFAVEARLAEPVEDPAPHVPALCAELCGLLEAAGFGARRVTLAVFRSDGVVSAVEAATARATRDPAHMARLFEGRLDRLDPGFGFDLVTLAAPVAEALPVRQPRLGGGQGEGEDLSRLVDRLAARFGPRALLRPGFHESHIPERREDWLPALGAPPLAPPPAPHRPLRLFDPPEEVTVVYALPEGPPAQFTWRRAGHRVVRFAGPERIGPEWWRDRPGTRLRDYYRVEDADGRRFWLFREGLVGDGRGGTPRWYVQGAFE